MSERFKASVNVNDSKNTRLPIVEEFSKYRFSRDALAHMFRYKFVCEKWIERSKELGRPIRILEIGCGDVYTLRVYTADPAFSFAPKKAYVEEYVGLDIDDKSVARTKATLPKWLDKCRVVCGDFTTGALSRFKDDEFDVVVCMEVIEHVQPKFIEPLLKEIRRIAPMALISTPNFTGGTGVLPDDHIKEWDVDELSELMVKCGLAVHELNGQFCNIAKVKKAKVIDQSVIDLVEKTCPADLASLVLARFAGKYAQNILYVCYRR